MKKLFQFIIVVMAIVLAFCAYVYMRQLGEQKGRENLTMAFTLQTVQAVTSEWKAEELKKRAHPLLLEAVASSGMTLDEYFKILQKLGKPKAEPACGLNSPIVVNQADGFAAASYKCEVSFENAPAVLTLESRQDGNEPWQVVAFHVDSTLFADLNKSNGDKKEEKK